MMVRMRPASMYSCTDSRGMLRSRSACTARSRSLGASARARAINSSALGMAFFGGALARVSTTVMASLPGFGFAPACARAGRQIKYGSCSPHERSDMRERPFSAWSLVRLFPDFASLIRAAVAVLRLHLRLVGDAGQAFDAAEHRQHIENAWRGGPAGERRAQRLRHRAELDAAALRKGAHGGLGTLGHPRLDQLEVAREV